MDMQRAFLAIIISFIILIGYQSYFMPQAPPVVPGQSEQQGSPTGNVTGNVVAPTESTQGGQISQVHQAGQAASTPQSATQAATQAVQAVQPVAVDPKARDITVETPLYTAVFSEQGGGLKSFVLKKYRIAKEEDAPSMEMISTTNPAELPMIFSLDNGAGGELPFLQAETTFVQVKEGEIGELTMTAVQADGIQIERHLTFTSTTYLIDSKYMVTNTGSVPLQISPAMVMTNGPFASGSTSSRYMFSGPAAYVNGKLEQIKPKKMVEGSYPLQGQVGWAAHVDNYFMNVLIPEKGNTGSFSVVGEDKVRTVLSGGIMKLEPGKSKEFRYEGFFGPKKLAYLRATGYDLAEAVNFGWFDILAKPMLYLLNFFHSVFGNYGIAIILLTCLIKGAFWPITQKGMKSMKNMQKLQPKVAKLRERHKDDPAKMNQEMMALYKTYKVNPIGGCLPMLIQIPFFFALYRVLMAAIELRHAPFMLWINDLSAPDRLMIGFDIPVLHGIPVLTVLMGASMYLQQKMTPTTADPTQAKIMQFLPIIFTVMFINFASGLVLYWFVNNLLSILQQQMINRQQKSKEEATA
ncbi:MAG: membrane protein insertase YidC [Candidatus Electrothrix sp. AW1]|nr:membrane protein insertase YidC [Candidatus Electrothrix sp. AX1]MCI5181642.1 membrane protein insertase YidC [Candidatus Electrothrix gigas]